MDEGSIVEESVKEKSVGEIINQKNVQKGGSKQSIMGEESIDEESVEGERGKSVELQPVPDFPSFALERSYKLVSVSERGQLSLCMETGATKGDLNLLGQDTEIAEKILQGVSGDMQVSVTVRAADGEEQISK